MKKISIITVCYNSDETIERTILSVLQQKSSSVEYIIIDGASSDKTMSIVEKYRCDIDQIVSEPDSGISSAFNKGIKLAKGEIIGLVNSDDWLEKNALSVVEEAFRKTSFGVLSGNILMWTSRDSCVIKKPRKGNPYFRQLYLHPATFVHKNIYSKLGLYKESLSNAMDFEFFLRLHLEEISIKYIDKTLSNFNFSGTGITSKNYLKSAREVRDVGIECGLTPLLAYPIYSLKVIYSKTIMPLRY